MRADAVRLCYSMPRRVRTPDQGSSPGVAGSRACCSHVLSLALDSVRLRWRVHGPRLRMPPPARTLARGSGQQVNPSPGSNPSPTPSLTPTPTPKPNPHRRRNRPVFGAAIANHTRRGGMVARGAVNPDPTPNPNPNPKPNPNPDPNPNQVARGAIGTPSWQSGPPVAVPQLAPCACSGRAWRLWLARHTPRERPGHWLPNHCLGCLS